jgi:hypothetical protein
MIPTTPSLAKSFMRRAAGLGHEQLGLEGPTIPDEQMCIPGTLMEDEHYENV